MPHRIVIVTPGAIGSNPRVVKEADALHEAGYQVHVCSTRTLDAVDQLDEALLRRVNWKCTRIDLRSRFARLAPRLLQTLAMRTWEVTGWAALSPTAFSAFTGPLYREVLRHQANLYIAHYPPALPVAAKAARIHKGGSSTNRMGVIRAAERSEYGLILMAERRPPCRAAVKDAHSRAPWGLVLEGRRT